MKNQYLLVHSLLFYLLCPFVLLFSPLVHSQENYEIGPNSKSYEGIPKGKVSKYNWKSKIYPNTSRDFYLYIPSQYNNDVPTALMIFQDGHAYVDTLGQFKVPVVFDNLIAQGKMPVTIGLFVNPGHALDAPEVESPWRSSNRSLEYDTVSDTYGKFLIEEMIPEIEKKYNISKNPESRAIAGMSSGGICAFSAAWFYPEAFHKVMSHIGSFTDIRGGHNYPSMIRTQKAKNIKVFLQDGSQDLNNQYGDWWLANLQMESALAYKGYNFKFERGTGGHNGQHGGAILPESLAWLWSDVVPKRIREGVYQSTDSATDYSMVKGETVHFSEMEFKMVQLLDKLDIQKVYHRDREQILIVKEGQIQVKVKGKNKMVGKNSVIVIMPGDKGAVKSITPKSTYYTMIYKSKSELDLKRGKKDGGSQIVDFAALEFKAHDKGGVRNYFHRSTAMCPYYEMHVTTLNPDIKSHEPHTHYAAEVVLVISGQTEMEIGNEVYRANKGDLYFLPSNVPHAIKNVGSEPCEYFAFQWN
ncbi:cupin domain-containing protein [Arenibacter sp. M-2]|uniref:cupin domain-containing protein n=1 Tax=Arenibacter sp. M-2 TaxID=3053612 RepID=UPI002570A23C|nr:cupin domain-containing protein [Arenibacter sp. M-2]MDL5512713.1 cupin domain-containing protein [Arenibacter sp. M-2]